MKVIGLTLALTTCALAVSAQASFVDYHTIEQRNELPEIDVVANAAAYTHTVGDEKLPFQLQLSAGCTAGSYWSMPWVQNTLPLTIFPYGQELDWWDASYIKWFGDDNIGYSRNWSGQSGKSHTAATSLDGSYEARAVEACNNLREDLVAGGMSNAQVLSQTRSIILPNVATANFSATCDNLVGNLFLPFGNSVRSISRISTDLDAVVNCHGTPGPGTPSNEYDKPFSVSNVNVAVTPKEFVGVCPKDITYHGNFETNAAGKVRYRFVGNGGFKTELKEMQVPGAGVWHVNGTRTVTWQNDTYSDYVEALEPLEAFDPDLPLQVVIPDEFTIKGLKLSAKKYDRIRLQIYKPYKTQSEDAYYTAQCVEPVTLLPVFPPPPRAIDPEPEVPVSDIASREGLVVGNEFTPWGGIIEVDASDAIGTERGRCKFRYRYDMVNLRNHDTQVLFANRLTDQYGMLDYTNQHALFGNESEYVTNHLLLEPGSHLVHLRLDTEQEEFETSEANNNYRATVIVNGTCQ